jgi:hypothetical protein
MRARLWLAAAGLLIAAPPASAEVIHLKNGKRVEAKVIERTDKFVKVDWLGVEVTYWMDEVERIDTTVSDVLSPRIVDAAPAAELTAAQRALVDEVQDLLGMQAFLKKLEGQTDEQLKDPNRQARMAKWPPEVREHFPQMFRDAFAADVMGPAIAASIGERFDEARLKAAVAWLREPLARKMVALESRHPGREEMEAFGRRLQERMPDEARLALIGRLDDAVHASELSLECLAAMMAGMSQPFVESGQTTPEEAEQMIGQMRQQLQGELGELLLDGTIAQMLMTYETVSDDELGKYVEWWESPDGRWLAGAEAYAIMRALAQASARLAQEMIRLEPVLKRAAPQAAAGP